MSGFFETVKVQKKKKAGEPLWLLAYVDLTTNLMALFILMLAMSKVDTNKFDAVSKQVTRQRTDSLDELQKRLDAEIKKRNLDKQVVTNLGMFGLNVEFLNGVMFTSASANLSPFALNEAKPLLDILSKVDKKYLLSLEGHTDDVPLSRKGKFRDNWSLSSARGVALLDKMRELGVPDLRMNISGFADTRPKIAIVGKSGKDLEAARASNRRVVIRVYQ